MKKTMAAVSRRDKPVVEVADLEQEQKEIKEK